MKRRVRQLSGFTLVELLAVILIIILIAGITLGVAGFVQRKAAVSRAQTEIAALELAIEKYKLDLGTYPASTSNRSYVIDNNYLLYTALAAGSKKYNQFSTDQLQSGWRTNYLGVWAPYTNVLDSFGAPYNYFYSGTPKNNAGGYDLWSYGPDRRTGTNLSENWNRDDITNWR